MRVSPASFRFNSQNSPSQKGFSKFIKVKGESLPRVRYMTCADEEFPQGGTEEQRKIIWEYYASRHLFVSHNKPQKFIYYLDYPLETTTIALQDAYYNGELGKYPKDLADKVRTEIEALERDHWDGCSKSALDKIERDREYERQQHLEREADRAMDEIYRM